MSVLFPDVGEDSHRGLREWRPLSPPHQDGVWLSPPKLELGTCELEENFDSQVRKPKSTAQVKELNLAS